MFVSLSICASSRLATLLITTALTLFPVFPTPPDRESLVSAHLVFALFLERLCLLNVAKMCLPVAEVRVTMKRPLQLPLGPFAPCLAEKSPLCGAWRWRARSLSPISLAAGQRLLQLPDDVPSRTLPVLHHRLALHQRDDRDQRLRVCPALHSEAHQPLATLDWLSK